jgi:hypothetical protein
MITARQQYVQYEATLRMNVPQFLDLIQTPDGHTVEAVLVGCSTPDNDYNGLFVHFTSLHLSKLNSFTHWGREADMLLEFYDYSLADDIVREIRRRWPTCSTYNYGCLCCSDDPPRKYQL